MRWRMCARPDRGEHRVGADDRPQRRLARQRGRLLRLRGEQRAHVVRVTRDHVDVVVDDPLEPEHLAELPPGAEHELDLAHAEAKRLAQGATAAGWAAGAPGRRHPAPDRRATGAPRPRARPPGPRRRAHAASNSSRAPSRSASSSSRKPPIARSPDDDLGERHLPGERDQVGAPVRILGEVDLGERDAARLQAAPWPGGRSRTARSCTRSPRSRPPSGSECR